MRGRLTAAVAGAALAASGCGGGEEGASTPRGVRECLQGKRYVTALRPADPALGTTGQVDVTLRDGRATVYFFTSQESAARQAVQVGGVLAGAGEGGHAVHKGRAVIAYTRLPEDGDAAALDGCLKT